MFMRRAANWLHPGEQIERVVRRHWIALLRRVIWPLFFLVLAFVVNMLVDYLFGVGGTKQMLPLIVIWVVILAWLIWEVLDWENDYLLVTNERLVLIERVYLVSERREDAPLQRIQDIKIMIPSLVANVLGYGNLSIETAGNLPIHFGPVGQPRQVQADIFRLAAGASAYGQPVGLNVTAPPASAGLPKMSLSEPQGLWQSFLSLFIVPRSTLGPDPVVYRKHPIVLVSKEVLPAIALLIWIFSLAAWPEIGALLRALRVPPVAGALVYALLGLAIFWGIVYNFIDWWNDLYVLNQNQVIDVRKVPLQTEDRAQASLGAIQNVRYYQPNPLAKLLSYGNIELDTAGRAGEFIFNYIPNPRQVQQMIFERAYQFRERAAGEERDKREREILDVVDRWWQTHQQLPPP